MRSTRQELSLCVRARYPIIWLLTWEELRAERLIHSIAQTTGKEVITWSLSEGFDPGQEEISSPKNPENVLRYILDCSKKAIYILKDFHHFMDQEIVVRLLRDITIKLKKSYKTVIIVSPELKIHSDLEKDITVFDLPLPTNDELDAVLKKLLVPYKDSNKVDVDLSSELVEKVIQATLGLTLKEAENVYAKALLKGNNFSAQDLPDIISEKQQMIRKSGILDFIPFSANMKDVGGLGKLKEWLQHREGAFSNKAREYGLPEPKGLLLVGVPGCGKSLAAKAIASEWRLPLLRLDVGKIFASFIGSSEQNMRKALTVAEAMSPAILWLDEIEKGFSGLKSSGSVDAGTTARIFGTFLTWMQEKTKPVFVIATANNVEELPPELLRKGRFDDIFFIDLPTVEERVNIYKIHISMKKRDPDKFDLKALASKSESFSGAEIEESVIHAMYQAFYLDRDISTDDVLGAIDEIVPLAVTANEKIRGIREWAKDRARLAS
ncbi:MAG: AAA family ATPase [Nitrospinales bacterium]